MMLSDSTHDERNTMMLKKKGGDASLRTDQLSAAEFKRKVQTLKKQIYELLTLCHVPGCLIIRSPDCSRTYMWPESWDDVRRVLELYTSKLGSGNKKAIMVGVGRCGADFRCESVDLFEKRLDGMSVDEERRLLRLLDTKIDSLRKRIELANVGSGGECGKVGTCKGLERLLEDGGMEDLSEDEGRKYLRDLERMVVAWKKRLDGGTLGKRKFGSLVENRIDGDRGEVEGDSVDEKLKQLSAHQAKQLLQEFESKVKCLARETNHAEDGTLLTMGRCGTVVK